MTTDSTGELGVEQQKIDRKIIHALAAGTPESWNAIDFIVEITHHEKHLEIAFEIESPEGHASEEADVTPELTSAIQELVALYKRHGRLIAKIEGHATHDASGWTYRGTFEYAS